MLVEQGDELFAEGGAADHPLEVTTPAVVVGAVELAAWEMLLKPPEECLVIGVHAEGDLGLATVSAEVPFTHQDAEEEACFEVGRLFHRRVSRETVSRVVCRSPEPGCCFTVEFPVKPPLGSKGLLEVVCRLFHRQVSRETPYIPLDDEPRLR